MTGSFADCKRFVRDNLCQRCWHPLVVLPLPDRQYKVACSNCGQEEYFVSRYYVDQRRAQDSRDYVDARCNLVKSSETKEKIISDLFGG